jgi:hypothetical protein
MNVGDTVLCDNKLLHNTDTDIYCSSDGLTIGKRYEVLATTPFSKTIIISNDYGNRYFYSKMNFLTLDEYRDKQIKKLLK